MFEVVDIFRGTTAPDSCDGVDRSSLAVSSADADRVLCLSFSHIGGEAYHAQVGECVYGPKDTESPWGITACSTGAFEVLQRFGRENDMGRCTDSTRYTDAKAFTNSDDYLDVVLCLSMIYPDDLGYARGNECLSVSQTASGPHAIFATSCASANAVVTGRTGEYNAAGFCGYDGWSTWRSRDFPEHAYTVCWRYL
ncbi:hypothetical protein [Nocardiopsis sp. CC223A]|uniref:hypothetical protein n=1 Tax=Nocardiopsis sp. CC223A TaxID=3044051 RepID=UPI00278BB7FC|nr:hypothetical protein [Nocardiopsis sp. CC223A]